MAWWLKLGILGLLAYLWIMGVGLELLPGLEGTLRPVVQAVGLAMVGAFIGLALAETTASFTGITPRLTAVFAVAAGIVLAMLADARGRPRVFPARSRY